MKCIHELWPSLWVFETGFSKLAKIVWKYGNDGRYIFLVVDHDEDDDYVVT